VNFNVKELNDQIQFRFCEKDARDVIKKLISMFKNLTLQKFATH